jgi:hypothetical protein
VRNVGYRFTLVRVQDEDPADVSQST